MIENLTIRRRQKRRSRGRGVFIAGAVLAGLLVVGYFVGKSWAESYLRSPEFLRFVNARVGKTLLAEAEFQPFQFNGLTVFSEGMKAQGFEGGPFASARLDQVRAEFSLRRFFEKVWQVETIEAQRVSIRLDGTRLNRPAETQIPQQEQTAQDNSGGWLPNRVEVGSAVIREFELAWGDLPGTSGALKRVEVRAVPSEGGWTFEGRNGELTAANFPPLTLTNARIRQRDGALFVNEAAFQAQGGGVINATGEVVFDDHVDIQAKLDGIDIQPFLTPDWRMRLQGKAAGELRIQSSLPPKRPVAVSGKVSLRDGRLEALPILNQVATFTRTQQFRSIKLTQASAFIERKGDQMQVRDFVAESTGLLRVEGVFTIAAGQIDGTFQVGVAPSTLQWLPGSQDRVFTVARDGYVWTSMRLTGPVDSPNEDLSQRLITAAGGAVIEKVESTTRDVLNLGRDAAKGALDFILPKGK